jgi:hypothetical protein
MRSDVLCEPWEVIPAWQAFPRHTQTWKSDEKVGSSRSTCSSDRRVLEFDSGVFNGVGGWSLSATDWLWQYVHRLFQGRERELQCELELHNRCILPPNGASSSLTTPSLQAGTATAVKRAV